MKVLPFIVVTEFGILMAVSLLQPLKVPSPIVVTEFGMLMEVSPLQPLFLQVVLYQRLALITVEKCQRGF